MNETKPERPRSLREHHKDVTRRRIRDAAREFFIAQGLDNTSVEEIAVRAGVSRATFYVHYANKQDVLVELIREAERERRALYQHLSSLPTVTRAAVRGWIASHIEALQTHRQNFKLFYSGLATNPEVHKAIVESRLELIEDLGRRFEKFSMKGRRGLQLERKRVEAVLMIIQVEQFCLSMVNQDRSMNEAAGLDVLTDRLFGFLNGDSFQRSSIR